MEFLGEYLNQILIVAGVLILAYLVYLYMSPKSSSQSFSSVEPLDIENMEDDSPEYFDTMDEQQGSEQ